MQSVDFSTQSLLFPRQMQTMYFEAIQKQSHFFYRLEPSVCAYQVAVCYLVDYINLLGENGFSNE